MSHFVMMVRVPADVPAHALHDRVAEMLAPYCEHTDEGRSSRFFEFVDDEPELRREYAEGSSEMVRCPDGSLVYPWDDRFRVLGTFGSGSDTHRVPQGKGYATVNVPHRDRFATLDAFATDYHGTERDEQGHLGHMRNPNAKWDWWQVGGRWRGKLRVRPDAQSRGIAELDKYDRADGIKLPDAARADWCRIADIDFDAAAREAAEKVAHFWREVELLTRGHKFNFFDGPHEAMLALKILDCKNRSELTGSEFWTKPWDRDVERFDVIATRPDPEALREVALSHFDPIRPWGYLDASGWCENGSMGWWGMSDATPESRLAAAREWNARLGAGDPNDWVVIVDCHI